MGVVAAASRRARNHARKSITKNALGFRPNDIRLRLSFDFHQRRFEVPAPSASGRTKKCYLRSAANVNAVNSYIDIFWLRAGRGSGRGSIS